MKPVCVHRNEQLPRSQKVQPCGGGPSPPPISALTLLGSHAAMTTVMMDQLKPRNEADLALLDQQQSATKAKCPLLFSSFSPPLIRRFTTKSSKRSRRETKMAAAELSRPHWGQVATALAVLVLTWLLARFAASLQRKMRIAKSLEPVPGPRGTFLLGILPEIAANMPRFYDFQARLRDCIYHSNILTRHLLLMSLDALFRGTGRPDEAVRRSHQAAVERALRELPLCKHSRLCQISDASYL